VDVSDCVPAPPGAGERDANSKGGLGEGVVEENCVFVAKGVRLVLTVERPTPGLQVLSPQSPPEVPLGEPVLAGESE